MTAVLDEAAFVVGMETSGETRDAIMALGHSAISIDLLPHQKGGPHHVGDVFEYLEGRRFRFGLFHPTCTYHTGSAAWAFNDADFTRYPGVGYHQRVKADTLTGQARRDARAAAERDVQRIRYLPFPKAIENPVGTLSRPANLGVPSDIVQPYEFGSDASKKTCLWFFDAAGQPLNLKLPRDPAAYVKPRLYCPSCRKCSTYDAAFTTGCTHCGAEAGLLRPRWANQTDTGQNALTPGDNRWQVRSDTYPGIAAALARIITEYSPGPRTGLFD